MRASGIWTVHDGRQWRVVGRVDGATIRLRDDAARPAPEHEVPATEVGPIEKVSTRATWRGGTVTLGRVVEPGVVGFYCDDAGLAARESLHGDQHQGWTGTARVEELVDVVEKVTVLRGGEDRT